MFFTGIKKKMRKFSLLENEVIYVRNDVCKWRRSIVVFGFVTKILLVNSAFLAFWSKFSFVSLKYARVSWDDFAIVRDYIKINILILLRK